LILQVVFLNTGKTWWFKSVVFAEGSQIHINDFVRETH